MFRLLSSDAHQAAVFSVEGITAMKTYTFYSFKGGVGRSMALANVAEWFYRQHLRVAMIDWDLEAPGLENFFHDSKEKLEKVRSRLGLIDLLTTYKKQFPELLLPNRKPNARAGDCAQSSAEGDEMSECIGHNQEVLAELQKVLPSIKPLLYSVHGSDYGHTQAGSAEDDGGALWLLPAGWRAGDPGGDRFAVYGREVQRFNWAEFYDQFEGEAFFEWLRSELEKYADVLLIDSRTGVTEMGGVCTRQLADVVVSFCAPNRQNLEGVVGIMAESFTSAKVMRARNYRPLNMIIVPSRIDDNEDKDRSDFKKLFASRIEELNARTHNENNRLEPLELWDLLIPYIAKYAYNEKLAIGVKETNEKLVKAYEKLAAYLAWFDFEEIVLNKSLGPELKRVFDGRLPHTPVMAPNLPEGYVERPAMLQLLLDPFLSLTDSHTGATVVLQGLGGTGKTTLAAALGHDPRVRLAFKDGILWSRLGNEPDLVAEMTRLYTVLMGERRSFESVLDVTEALNLALRDKVCLLVIDDVWNEAHLRPFMDVGRNCSRLITTRNLNIALEYRAVAINVEEMREPEAVQLLSSGIELTAGDSATMLQIAHQVGYLPLALSLINISLLGNIAAGEPVGKALDSISMSLSKDGLSVFERSNRNQQSLHSSILNSVNRLDLLDQKHLDELGVFPDTDIPLEIVAALWEMSESETRELAQRLNDYSMIRLNLQDGSIRLHPVMRDFLQERVKNAPALHAKLVESFKRWTDPAESPKYAWRWLAYHLAKAGNIVELRKNLTSFRWLCEKLTVAGAQALVSAYNYLPEDQELHPLQDALRLAASLFMLESDQSHLRGCLAGQLFGRLALSPTPAIASLLEEARQSHESTWLKPLTPSLTLPGEPLLCTLLGHTEAVTALAMMPDGSHVISASYDGTLRIWNLENGTQLKVIKGETTQVPDDSSGGSERGLSKVEFTSVAVIGEGKQVLTGSSDGTLSVWNIETGAEEFVLRGHGAAITNVAVTLNGKRAVSASEDRTLKVWDLEMRQERVTLRGHTRPVTSVAITPDGQRIISGSLDQTMRVWDLESGTRLQTFADYRTQNQELWLQLLSSEVQYAGTSSSNVNAIAISPDGKQLVSDAARWTLKIWNLNSETAQSNGASELNGHTADITAVAASANGRLVASASEDFTVRVWDLKTKEPLNTLVGHSGSVRGVTIAPDGQRIISGAGDNTLKIWDWRRQYNPLRPRSHTRRVTGVVFAPDGKRAVSGSLDCTIRLSEVATGVEVFSFRPHKGGVIALAITPDGERLITASVDRTIKVWEMGTDKEIFSLPAQARPVLALAVLSDGKRFISASDEQIKIWDLDKHREVLAIDGLNSRVSAIAVTPDGQRLFYSSFDRTISMVGIDSGEKDATLKSNSLVTTIAATSNKLVYGSDDYTVNLLSLGHTPLGEHKGAITGVAVSADERFAVSVSSDHILRFWDLETRSSVAGFGGDSALTSCAISPDGLTIIAGEESGRLHFLGLEGVA